MKLHPCLSGEGGLKNANNISPRRGCIKLVLFKYSILPMLMPMNIKLD